jgi:hypothetical protein
MKTKLQSFIIMLALLAGVHRAAANIGTAFTYQGQLTTDGGPANGTYDLTYKLWNALGGGTQVGSTITITGTVISNGLFSATLDFGSQFNGTSYWLELAVRTNGVGSYNTLNPRQPLTPTPYAITAQNVAGLVPGSQLSGDIPPSSFAGTYPNPVTLNNAGNVFDGIFTGTFSGTGTGLTGVALLAGGNTFAGNQNINGMLDISDGSGATYHTDQTIGPGGYSAGEEHSINFDDGGGHIGSLIVGWDGTSGYFSAGNLYQSGSHLTGTKAFTVFGNGNVIVDPQSLNTGFLNNGSTNSSGLTFGSTSGEGIASQRTAGVDQYSLEFYTAFVNRMIIVNNGFVGINTTNPAAQLDVESASTAESAYSVYGVISSTSPGGFSTGVRGQNNGTGGSGIGVWGSQAGSGWGGYFTSASGIGVNVSGGTGIGVEASGATGVYASGSTSALTIGSGAIHVSGAGNNTSTAAFTQITADGNITGSETLINNPLCNGDPNAILLVTHNDNPGGVFHGENNHAVGVFYTGSEWSIYNEDNTTMAAGLAFNVLIIKN